MRVVILVIGSLAAATVQAGQRKTSGQCAKIRKAVNAGHTLDQITGEYDTDAEHVMKCLEQKGHRKKPKVEKKKHGATSGKQHQESGRSGPTTSRPEKMD